MPSEMREPVKCGLCNQLYDSKPAESSSRILQQTLRDHRCMKCNEAYMCSIEPNNPTMMQAYLHLGTHECTFNITSFVAEGLAQHRLSKCSNKFACRTCTKQFDFFSERKDHEILDHFLLCEFCPNSSRSFSTTEEECIAHRRAHESETWCKYCEKGFGLKELFQIHRNSAGCKRPRYMKKTAAASSAGPWTELFCAECKVWCRSSKMLEEHRRQVHGGPQSAKEDSGKGNMSKGDTPMENTAKESAPKENTPMESMPEENKPKGNVPQKNMPQENRPKENEPEGKRPKENEPKENTRKEDMPKKDMPEENTPKENTPKQKKPVIPQQQRQPRQPPPPPPNPNPKKQVPSPPPKAPPKKPQPPRKPKDLYDLLGITPRASHAQIEQAAKKRRIETHPDRLKRPGMSPDELAVIDALAKEVGGAADLLLDQRKRLRYDRELRATRNRGQQQWRGKK
ncbi:MAG: hypothetical protein Q9190_002639 [Brigantiaea leucoxantha]